MRFSGEVCKEFRKLVDEIRSSRSESETIEVKTAHEGTPKKLYRTLSAFSNQAGGGVILFGLDESKGFAVAGVKDAQRLQEEITHMASQDMEPALRPHFTIGEFDGETVVAVEVDEIPCDAGIAIVSGFHSPIEKDCLI